MNGSVANGSKYSLTEAKVRQKTSIISRVQFWQVSLELYQGGVGEDYELHHFLNPTFTSVMLPDIWKC